MISKAVKDYDELKEKITEMVNNGYTLEMLYDTELNYYFRLNFTGFVDIIDALGGIDVESDYSFSTHGYSYNQGLNSNLSGIEALWFARERHAFAEGDRQRGKDQMKVIEGVLEKCQSTLGSFVENVNNPLVGEAQKRCRLSTTNSSRLPDGLQRRNK